MIKWWWRPFRTQTHCYRFWIFSENEVEKLDILDAFFEEHTITREEISSKAKTAIEYVFSEFVGTPVKNDMYLFKQRIIEHFQIYSEWYQSQSSIIEDIGLICLLEGEKTYPAKQQHYFLWNLMSILILMNTNSVQYQCWIGIQCRNIAHIFSFWHHLCFIWRESLSKSYQAI